MTAHTDRPVAFVVEDWRPVARKLSEMLEVTGYQAITLPNVFELVARRVERDRPDVLFVNAQSLVIGDLRAWRAMLGSMTATVIVMPADPSAEYLRNARDLRADGILEGPPSVGRLALALDIALRNRRAARRLRREVGRLRALRGRPSAPPRTTEPQPAPTPKPAPPSATPAPPTSAPKPSPAPVPATPARTPVLVGRARGRERRIQSERSTAGAPTKAEHLDR